MPFFVFAVLWSCVLVSIVSGGRLLYLWRTPGMQEDRLVGPALLSAGMLTFSIVIGLAGTFLIQTGPQPAIPVQERFIEVTPPPFSHPRYLYAETLYKADVVLWIARKLPTADDFRGYIVYYGLPGELDVRVLNDIKHQTLYSLARECILEGNIGGTCRKLRTHEADGYAWDGPETPVAGYAFRVFGGQPKPLPGYVTQHTAHQSVLTVPCPHSGIPNHLPSRSANP